MSFQLIDIKDKKDLVNERVVFKVLKNINAHFFIVLHTRHLPSLGKIDTNALNMYWFLSCELKQNDLVVLYTKYGQYSTKENGDGSQSHFFYWGKDKPLFITTEDCAVVIEVLSWATTMYEQSTMSSSH